MYVASWGWATQTSSMFAYSQNVLEALRSAGVDAVPLVVPLRHGARHGGTVLPWIRRALRGYPAHGAGLVHQTDTEALRGVDVVTIQDLAEFRGFRPRLDRLLDGAKFGLVSRRARRLVFTTRAMLSEFAQRMPARADKGRVVPMPFAPTDSHREPSRYDALWVGLAAEHKRPLAFVRLAERHPERTFAQRWGPSPRFRRLGEDLRVAQARVRNLTPLTTALSPEDLDTLYRSSRVCVATSSYEGWHAPVTEARLRGCQVVVPRIEPYLSIYSPTDAFFYEPDSEASLDQVLDAAIRTGPRAPSTSLVHLVSYANVGRALRAVYEELLPR